MLGARIIENMTPCLKTARIVGKSVQKRVIALRLTTEAAVSVVEVQFQKRLKLLYFLSQEQANSIV